MNPSRSWKRDPNTTMTRRRWGVVAALALACVLLVLAGSQRVSAAPTRVLMDGESFPNGFTVPPGEVWEFDPGLDTKVTTSGNVVVLGTLRMRPAHGGAEHFLQFTDIDESKFVGGGMTHVDAPSDIGLWVEDTGVLDISGTPVTPWSYQWEDDWSSSDDIVAAPNTPGEYASFQQVDSISDVPSENALGYKTELLNLTRNVRIEGTPTGRTHILIHAPNATGPQTIEYASIRYVGPWIGDEDASGRYGIHFHHNQYATAGTKVTGVVVRDGGNHGFVPHASHGITFTDTIAYTTTGAAYWWDASGIDVCGDDTGCNETFDLVYDSVVAADGQSTPIKKHTGTAIWMGGGENITVRDSVVVGMNGRSGADTSAFEWPSRDRGVWEWTNNVAHNNRARGIFVWQNTGGDAGANHVIDGLTAFYNEFAGVEHGAYGNAYLYQNLTLLDNALGSELGIEQFGAIQSHALGKQSLTIDGFGATDTQEWYNTETGGARLVVYSHHTPGKPIRFVYCDFSEVSFFEGTLNPGGIDFIECGLDIDDFDRSGIHSGTVIRVQDGNTAYQFTGNGPVQTIEPFYDGAVPPATTTTVPVTTTTITTTTTTLPPTTTTTMRPPPTTTTTTVPPTTTTTTGPRCRRC